jgi:manganese transport protein
MIDFLKKQLFTVHQNGKHQVSEVFKFIGPGIIVTVGFIDPGNWAANLAAGASYGYELLWVVTLSTIMLILLQHNVAHLGIVRGQCLSECAYEFLPRYVSRFVLSTAGIAAAATALAYLIEVNMVNVDWAAAGIGWMINSAMILLAAAVFFTHGIEVTELEQAEELLRPLIGPAAGTIFAIALLFAGFASSATAGMAGASIFAGMFGESYDMKDFHTRLGLALTYIPALLLIVFVTDSFQALLISQMFLSLQLPITIFLQLYMTSSRKVMGQYANHTYTNVLLWGIGIVVTVMNIYLLIVG